MTKQVLITGVSSGIGLAQARLFLEKGYQVYGVDQGADPQLSGDFHFLQRDLTLDLTPIFDWCPEVEILCNTAGVLDDYKPLLEQSAEEIQEIFEINYVTPVELTRHYLTQMLEKKQGTVINMCSIASSLAGRRRSRLYLVQACSSGLYQAVGPGLCRSWYSSLWHCAGGRQNRHDRS